MISQTGYSIIKLHKHKGVVFMESLTLFKYSRTSTLILLNNIDKDKWDEQPSGYPNTIRWNAGHVYSTAEDYLTDADKDYKITHPEWNDLFLDGTRPSEWQGNIPTAEEIISALEEQEKRIYNHFKNKLDQKASVSRDVNAMMLDTVDLSLQFVTWHEGIHLGFMNGMRRVFD